MQAATTLANALDARSRSTLRRLARLAHMLANYSASLGRLIRLGQFTRLDSLFRLSSLRSLQVRFQLEQLSAATTRREEHMRGVPSGVTSGIT